ncbi:hypothetical protein Lalb_Chr23g0273921 [Lupinus albus]|uniref:Uncharacterized protein n=1 Tax=Lupinus albus TaxID=3870 RepID=A0A6A4MWU5_LUPAL|nr:hypothetical protein Lalb_Chr23g0273921 [Lupinus albus]
MCVINALMFSYWSFKHSTFSQHQNLQTEVGRFHPSWLVSVRLLRMPFLPRTDHHSLGSISLYDLFVLGVSF